MTNSTDAANSGNPGKMDKRRGPYRKSLEQIEFRNRGKLLPWYESDDMSEFVTTEWGNIQIDPSQVYVGHVLLMALKEEVLIGSHRGRLIARWNTITVRSPELCWVDDMQHSMSVCTECIHDSWLWDHLFRDTEKMHNFKHGTAKAYDMYGCRCDWCHAAWSMYIAGRPNATLGYVDIVPV